MISKYDDKHSEKNQPKYSFVNISRLFIIRSFRNNNCKSNVNHVLLSLLKALALFYHLNIIRQMTCNIS